MQTNSPVKSKVKHLSGAQFKPKQIKKYWALLLGMSNWAIHNQTMEYLHLWSTNWTNWRRGRETNEQKKHHQLHWFFFHFDDFSRCSWIFDHTKTPCIPHRTPVLFLYSSSSSSTFVVVAAATAKWNKNKLNITIWICIFAFGLKNANRNEAATKTTTEFKV